MCQGCTTFDKFDEGFAIRRSMTATKVANLLFMLRSRDWEDSAVEGGGGAHLDILEQVQHDQ